MRLVPIGAHLRTLPASQWRLFFPSGHLTLYLPIPAVLCLLVVSGSWSFKRPLLRCQPGNVTVQHPHLLDVLEKVRMTLASLPCRRDLNRGLSGHVFLSWVTSSTART